MKRIITCILAFVLALAVLTGCGGSNKASIDDIKAGMEKAQTEIKDLSGEYLVDIQLTFEAMGQKIDFNESIKAQMESTVDPSAAHIKMNINIDAMGKKENYDAEAYSIENGEGGYSVYATDGKSGWQKSQTDKLNTEALTDASRKIIGSSDLQIEGTEKINERECYVVSGAMAGKGLQDVLGQVDNSGTFASAFSAVDLSKINIPVKIWVDTESYLTYKATIDMGEAMKTIFTEAMKATTGVEFNVEVQKGIIEFTFGDYNTGREIIVPDEAKAVE